MKSGSRSNNFLYFVTEHTPHQPLLFPTWDMDVLPPTNDAFNGHALLFNILYAIVNHCEPPNDRLVEIMASLLSHIGLLTWYVQHLMAIFLLVEAL